MLRKTKRKETWEANKREKKVNICLRNLQKDEPLINFCLWLILKATEILDLNFSLDRKLPLPSRGILCSGLGNKMVLFYFMEQHPYYWQIMHLLHTINMNITHVTLIKSNYI